MRSLSAAAAIVALFCCASFLFAQTPAAEPQHAEPAAARHATSTAPRVLVPYRKGEKWGYCTLRKKMVIDPQFDAAGPFFEGLAVVVINHKSGYIDRSGKIVIPAGFDHAWGFKDGAARVEVGGKYGKVNKRGAFIVPAKYDFIGPVSDGMSVVRLGNKFGAVDANGKEITGMKYDGMGEFGEGLAAVHLDSPAEPHPGATPPAGQATPAAPANPPDGGRCGYIDKTGREVIPAKFSICSEFSEGLASVKPFEPPSPGSISPSREKELAAAGAISDYGAFVDKTGTIVIPTSYDYYLASFHEGLAAVGDHYIDKTGKTVLSPDVDEVYRFSEGLALVEKGGEPKEAPLGVQKGRKFGYIDKSGKLVIPLQFDQAGMWTMSEFHEGLAAVMLNGKYGFIDKTGKLVIPAKYSGVFDFSDGLAPVYSSDNPVEVLTSPDPNHYLLGFIGKDGTEYF